MTIRTRLTLGYAGMLLGSLLFMGGVLHYELVGEYKRGRIPESPAEKISDIVLFYGVPTLILLVLGGSWLVHRALRPVAELAASAERVHAGNLTERIALTGRGDELDRLAGVFNAMLARLEAGVASVRDFTLHASHELKTPLTIMSAETELALADPGTSKNERLRLASQLEEIRRLTGLVETLSLLAKVDAGLPVIVREPVHLDELVRTAVDDIQKIASRRAITVELVECAASLLKGDRAALRQVLLNALGNAVKHNHDGGWVRVLLRAEGRDATLLIENTGEPIASDLRPRLFDRFVRGPTVNDGAGLGLSIIKSIVEAHGGTVRLIEPTRGTTRLAIQLPK